MFLGLGFHLTAHLSWTSQAIAAWRLGTGYKTATIEASPSVYPPSVANIGDGSVTLEK